MDLLRLDQIDIEEMILLALENTSQGTKIAHVHVNCSEELAAGLLQLIENDPRTKKDLTELALMLATILHDDNQKMVERLLN